MNRDHRVVVNQPAFISSLHTYDPATMSLSAWLEMFEEFCFLNNIPTEAEVPNAPRTRRRALFLSYLGPQAYEALRVACLPVLPSARSINSLVALLKERFEPAGLVARGPQLLKSCVHNR